MVDPILASRFRTRRVLETGFTRIEFLVIIAIVAILIAPPCQLIASGQTVTPAGFTANAAGQFLASGSNTQLGVYQQELSTHNGNDVVGADSY